MKNIDQDRFDNQHKEFLSAREAAELLGVKLATLYAYASRGMVKSVPGAEGARDRRYARADLERLRARHDARSGHGPVAGAALRWGEPVLDSAITFIGERGPHYRGVAAVDLARAGARFEAVAEMLWGGEREDVRWPADGLGVRPARVAALLGEHAPPILALSLAVPALAALDPLRFDVRPEAETRRARTLIRRAAALLALGFDQSRASAAARLETVAASAAFALGAASGAGDAVSREVEAAVDRCLVVSADHELNASAFAARVAAGTGADLYACVSAALAALSGPEHGGACDRVEAFVAEAGRPDRARRAVAERVRRGESVPGFGHRLYAAGDPRAGALLEAARAIAPRDGTVKTMFATIDAMADAGYGGPTLDCGLVAVAAALGLPTGSPAGLFALGRSAGWVAHVLEQRASGFALRPRARYVGSK